MAADHSAPQTLAELRAALAAGQRRFTALPPDSSILDPAGWAEIQSLSARKALTIDGAWLCHEPEVSGKGPIPPFGPNTVKALFLAPLKPREPLRCDRPCPSPLRPLDRCGDS
jgi:hypothetical protein